MEASLSRFCSRFCFSLLAGNNLKSVLPFCAIVLSPIIKGLEE